MPHMSMQTAACTLMQFLVLRAPAAAGPQLGYIVKEIQDLRRSHACPDCLTPR